jgi:hypothetical protein
LLVFVRYRHFVLTPFQLMIIYRMTDQEIQVLRLTHAMREPEAIQAELEGRAFT